MLQMVTWGRGLGPNCTVLGQTNLGFSKLENQPTTRNASTFAMDGTMNIFSNALRTNK